MYSSTTVIQQENESEAKRQKLVTLYLCTSEKKEKETRRKTSCRQESFEWRKREKSNAEGDKGNSEESVLHIDTPT